MSWSVRVECFVCGMISDEGYLSDAIRPRIAAWTLRRAADHQNGRDDNGNAVKPCGPVSVVWKTGPGQGREPGEGFGEGLAHEQAQIDGIVDMMRAAWRGEPDVVRRVEMRTRTSLARLSPEELVDLRRNIKEALSEVRRNGAVYPEQPYNGFALVPVAPDMDLYVNGIRRADGEISVLVGDKVEIKPKSAR